MAYDRPMRRMRTTTLLLALMVALAACGGGGGTAAKPTAAAARLQAARRYAQCIRDNGAPDFPDPNAKGQFRGGAHDRPNDPNLQAAQAKCRSQAPGGEHQSGNPATVKQLQVFAQCMRDNGMPNFPDPDAKGEIQGGHDLQNDPNFQSALDACQSKLPGGLGSHGG
jgi:hypothetical protein